MSAWNAVLPVITLILGYLGTLFTEERRDLRAARRAREDREAARSEVLRERREGFELQHLLETHAAMSTLHKAVWGGEDDMDQWSIAIRAVEEASRFCSLILEDDLREQVQTAIQGAQVFINQKWIMGMRDPELSKLAVDLELVLLHRTAQRLLSGRIRGIYVGSVTTP